MSQADQGGRADSGGVAVIEPRPAEEGRDLFGIAELAEEFGITTRTIRFYENKDLIHPARVNGARVYTRRDRARLALILRAKAIGSTLAQIRHFLDLYGEHGEGQKSQLEYVVSESGKAIEELERKRAMIDDTLGELHAIRKTCIDCLKEL
ncbi:MerR family transcriptional regulator [Hoeflea poritis]|uniref:MerR family DNA-binding transcriptional regulator n=1 Tax=Hoeflea poritis TaxID=2993659 RepID=A0ABT4VRA0_9HYPH|nr:MerR family DNA-binding transcriptional regulator [Hoeflea poritis]MDA4847228.1 MerR family DNA-binding transcriptional regulator [Hoeflea poritis]